VKTRFPSPTKGAGTSSTTDYEQLTYENTSSGTSTSDTVATFRNRAAESTSFTYDNLTRLTTENLPGSAPDVTYAYDNLGRLTSASRPDYTVTFAYDALGRQTLDGQGWGSISRQFDLAGNLTRVSWWDGFYVQYDRLVTGEVDKIRENGATSGIGVLADYDYNNLGRRISLTFGNGTSTSYTYDPVSRLSGLSHDLAGTANDLTIGSIAYNPASQIISLQRSNDAYAFTGHSSASTASVANGLNQLTSIGGSTMTHDARGNLTLDPVTDKTYIYDSQNQLIVASGGISVYYDPLGRMTEYNTNISRRFMYDGLDIAVEVDNPAGTIVRRFVHGPGVD
jgi:YD repeat-containing protein